MAVSYLKEHFVFRVMTEDVIEKCEDYTCEKDTEIEEFFKTRDENPRLACAFSLANSSVRVDRLSNKKRNKINVIFFIYSNPVSNICIMMP